MKLNKTNTKGVVLVALCALTLFLACLEVRKLQIYGIMVQANEV
jgi:hypothetical protein